jgi:hypothetical protein
MAVHLRAADGPEHHHRAGRGRCRHRHRRCAQHRVARHKVVVDRVAEGGHIGRGDRGQLRDLPGGVVGLHAPRALAELGHKVGESLRSAVELLKRRVRDRVAARLVRVDEQQLAGLPGQVCRQRRADEAGRADDDPMRHLASRTRR